MTAPKNRAVLVNSPPRFTLRRRGREKFYVKNFDFSDFTAGQPENTSILVLVYMNLVKPEMIKYIK
jgi:hypothetical protein